MNHSHQVFNFIDLAYLEEVSMGDYDYQKEMAAMFIEMLPKDLETLRLCFENQDREGMKKAAHHLLSTIYIMGLGKKLSPHLSAFKEAEKSLEQLGEHLKQVQEICSSASKEARIFLLN